MKFINTMQKFMIGRYGSDDLYKFQFKLLIVFLVINLFVNNVVLDVLELLNIVIIIYRYLSKNIYNRVKENELYLNIRSWFIRPFRNIKRSFLDKEHLYKRCSCGTTIKVNVPKKRGIKHAKCPSCGKRNRIIAFRCKKV